MTTIYKNLDTIDVSRHPILSQFTDMFPEELLGLPPRQEVEFTIELKPRTEPIDKNPYPMTTLELREFQIQLQELLDLGFIRTNISSWGAPVIFVKKKDGSWRLFID